MPVKPAKRAALGGCRGEEFVSGLLSRTASGEGLGKRAERHVHDRLREALGAEYLLFPNVSWLVRSHGVEREGEADIVIAHPEKGFLTIEVKSGPIARDGQGRWWAGGRPLDRAPFEQSADSHHSL
ncbi:MAG: NERD domain-containing protein, partial [Chloroflexota bacterium]